MRASLYSKYPAVLNLDSLSKLLLGDSAIVRDLVEHLKIHAEKALERLQRAVRGVPHKPLENPLDEVSSFYLAIALAQHAHGWLVRRLADYEGKRTSSGLMRERDSEVIEVLNMLGVEVEYMGGSDGCGHKVILGRTGTREVVACYPYRITIPRYLRCSEGLLSEPSWKLVNRLILGGYVYLGKRDLARLAEEVVKRKVLNYARIFSESFVGETLLEYVEKARELVPKYVVERESRAPPERVEKAFPPCIAKLKDSLSRGEHLSHHQRFALATFMLSVGYSTDDVVNAFRSSPDFDEKVARYQVEHLAGLRGGKKKYRVYSCEKMKSLGMCVVDCGTKSPLQHYRRAARRL